MHKFGDHQLNYQKSKILSRYGASVSCCIMRCIVVMINIILQAWVSSLQSLQNPRVEGPPSCLVDMPWSQSETESSISNSDWEISDKTIWLDVPYLDIFLPRGNLRREKWFPIICLRSHSDVNWTEAVTSSSPSGPWWSTTGSTPARPCTPSRPRTCPRPSSRSSWRWRAQLQRLELQSKPERLTCHRWLETW